MTDLLPPDNPAIKVSVKPGTAQASTQALPGGEIVFTRGVPPSLERRNLYVAAIDGSRLRLVVRNADNAAVSPSGRRLAFERNGAIWVSGRDGSAQRQLTRRGSTPTNNPVSDGTPTWSADGQAVYFARFVKKSVSSSLFSVRLHDGQVRPLTKNLGTSVAYPTCSPDGRIIVYAESGDPYHGSDTHLSAVTSAGQRTSMPFRLFLTYPTSRRVTEDTPAWSPDGRHLAFNVLDLDAWDNGRKIGASGLYVSTLHGAHPDRLSATGYSAAWAPDGKWIAFADRRGISFVPVDGSGLQRLGHTTPNDYNPAWLPPG